MILFSLSLSLSLDLTEQSTLLCPQTRTINSNDISSVPEWRMISSISGKFCTETNYSVHEMCVIENNSSILVINDNFYANISRGEITVTFVHNVTVSNILTVRFGKYDIIYYYVIDISLADFGIYPQITYTTATEGDAGISFAFDIYIEKGKLATSSVSLYHMKNDTNTTINIMISPPKFLSCENHYPGSCQCTKDEEIAHVYKVTIPNPTPANDGIYLLEVTVDSRTFSASITLSGNIFNISIELLILYIFSHTTDYHFNIYDNYIIYINTIITDCITITITITIILPTNR